MAGDIHVLTDVFTDEADNTDNNRNLFAAIAEYFDTHPNFTRIASDFDGGPGFGVTNGVSESNENAWGVWRAQSASIAYDVACKWSYSQFWDDDWQVASDFGVGIVVAFHSSSEAWNGTTNNDGTDSFSTSPWKSGSMACPRVNGPGGSEHSNRRAMMSLNQGTSAPQRMHIAGDDDTTIIALDQDNDGDIERLMVLGTYTPVTAAFDVPLMMWACDNIDVDTTYGNTSLTLTDDGGVVARQADDVRSFRLDFDQYLAGGPGSFGAPGSSSYALESAPPQLYTYEAGFYRLVGSLPLLRLVKTGINFQTTLAGGRRHTFKMAAGGVRRGFSMPWKGVPAGLSGSYAGSRAGR